MVVQLFNKSFKLFLLAILAVEIISFLFFKQQFLLTAAFAVITLSAFAFSLKKTEYGLYFILTELLIGSKGYLFFLSIGELKISIRIGLFIAILSAWLIKLLLKQESFKVAGKILIAYALLALFIITAAVSGLLHNSLPNWFLDFNGWLYFLLLPIFASGLNRPTWPKILNLILVAAGWLSLKTLLVFSAFSFNLPTDYLYFWLRNSGVGEITYVIDNFYRVFFQAHLFTAIGLMLAICFLLFKNNSKQEKIGLTVIAVLASLAMLISLSRSFWIGIGTALIGLLVFLLINHFSFTKILKYLVIGLIILALEISWLCLISRTYKPQLFWGRLSEASTEAAGSSRLNQLKPASQAIQNNWLSGAGFGSTITYTSNDPRIRAQSPNGLLTTHALELGYLDIWLKMGTLGILAYLWLTLLIARGLLRQGTLGLALFLGLIVLIATNAFSPYLNHPLGIGYLLLSSALPNLKND